MNQIIDMAMVLPQATGASVEPKSPLKTDSGKLNKDNPDFSKVIAAATEVPEKKNEVTANVVSKREELSDDEKVKIAAAAGAGGIVNPNLLLLFPQVSITAENVVSELKIASGQLLSDAAPVMNLNNVVNNSGEIILPTTAVLTAFAEVSQLPPTTQKPDHLLAAKTTMVTEDKVSPVKTPITEIVAALPSQNVFSNNVNQGQSEMQQTQIAQSGPIQNQNQTNQTAQPITNAAVADLPQASAIATSTANRPAVINPAEVVSIKTPNETKPADTMNLEVAPGIERMRIQPPEAGLASDSEQAYSDSGTAFASEQPLVESKLLKPDETIPEFSVPAAISSNGIRHDNVGAIPVQAPPSAEQHSVYRQVLDGMTTAGAQMKTSEIIITLKPEQLGEVTVKISVDGNRVAAVFHSANPEVRGILESSMTQLRQEMSQQGWQFDHGGVYGEMNGFLGQQNRQQQEQQLAETFPKKRQEGYESIESTSLANSSNTGMTAMSVDYRV